MARTANPNKDIIDGHRKTGKDLLAKYKANLATAKKAEKDNVKILADLGKTNTKLEKLEASPIALPDNVPAPEAPKVKAKTGKEVAPTAKTGKPGRPPAVKPIATAPKKGRGRKADGEGGLSFD